MNDKDIRSTIIKYSDRQNDVVTLAYLCLKKERQGSGNYVDNGNLLVYVKPSGKYLKV